MEEISFFLLPVSLEKGRLKKEGFKKDEGGIFFLFFLFSFFLFLILLCSSINFLEKK